MRGLKVAAFQLARPAQDVVTPGTIAGDNGPRGAPVECRECGAGVGINGVVATTRDDQVFTLAAEQKVSRVPRDQDIVAGSAIQQVAEPAYWRAAFQQRRVESRQRNNVIAVEPIVTGAAKCDVASSAGFYQVVAGSAFADVAPRAQVQPVIAQAGMHAVVSPSGNDLVVDRGVRRVAV